MDQRWAGIRSTYAPSDTTTDPDLIEVVMYLYVHQVTFHTGNVPPFYFVLLVFFCKTYQLRSKIPIHLQGCADMIPLRVNPIRDKP